MSTAANHRKRSHRSQYRARCFTGSRRAVVTPTLSRPKLLDIIRKMRQFFQRKRRVPDAQDTI